ncbi:unnamed protein product [Echinostoma caproni]|uniref:Membrane magnesium transporter n=1 Tax=Echinostoma caproni TaxID=27848 RepID=A0A183AKZ4_9TREM|nr:unnamed protein product [Echinostoma caproni]
MTLSLFGLGLLTTVFSLWGIIAVWLGRKSLIHGSFKFPIQSPSAPILMRGQYAITIGVVAVVQTAFALFGLAGQNEIRRQYDSFVRRAVQNYISVESNDIESQMLATLMHLVSFCFLSGRPFSVLLPYFLDLPVCTPEVIPIEQNLLL